MFIRFIFFSLVAVVGLLPFIGPVAVSVMVLTRWYWASLSAHHPPIGALRNILYVFVGPLAVVGSINISSWLPMLVRVREISAPTLNSLEAPWVNVAYPIVSKILGVYTGFHDWINTFTSTDVHLLPGVFWIAAKSTDPAATSDFMVKSGGSFLPLFALVYVVFSFMSHLDVARRIRKHRIAQARRNQAETQYVEAETKRIKAGGIPKMSNGKPSALEF